MLIPISISLPTDKKIKFCYIVMLLLVVLSHDIPCTSTAMSTLLELAETSTVLFPLHVYTPLCVGYWASTMWSVDIALLGVIVVTKGLLGLLGLSRDA